MRLLEACARDQKSCWIKGSGKESIREAIFSAERDGNFSHAYAKDKTGEGDFNRRGRFGRQRWIILVMGSGMVVSAGIGFSPAISYPLAVGLVLIYGSLIWADSASLTAGAAGSAVVGQRGATLAVHSALGYTGGFIGPLSIGIMLDIFGAETPIGWGLAFLASIGILAVGPLATIILKPKSLAGDR